MRLALPTGWRAVALGALGSGTSMATISANDPLVGFGATIGQWNRHHQADTE